ncbi:hypothetical protein DSO57_1002638 [Entomophthora muscae]|uniref:Uncharacterized protein n=1 Tax=Entomophthora muscae TaxID=34485 RepID=A0ACC2SXY4_9FUNG|nr:hypothetical protein DSO57_1002638 [Entomophthora muscae]
MGRFAFLGHFGHLAMVTVPIGLVIAGLNVGALAHQIGKLFPLKWAPDNGQSRCPAKPRANFPACWKTEQLLAASDQPTLALVSSPRVLDQEITPAPEPILSFPGAPLLCQLAL